MKVFFVAVNAAVFIVAEVCLYVCGKACIETLVGNVESNS